MSIWIASLLIAFGGMLFGLGLALLALRQLRGRPAAPRTALPHAPLPPLQTLGRLESSAPMSDTRTGLALRLASEALRGPLRQLRRAGGVPPEPVEELAELARQLRLLVASPRAMRTLPTSPMQLLEKAAEQVPVLRLGKIPISWSLLCRQPVEVDAARAEAGFAELLRAAAVGAGAGGRLGVKVVAGKRPRYPVRVEIEVGSRGADAEPLAILVGRHLLEAQGALVEEDGRTLCVSLISTQPDTPAPQELGTAAEDDDGPDPDPDEAAPPEGGGSR